MLIKELIEKAFCEGYEYAQKEYARKDYEGLTKRQKEELRKRRRDYAIGLNKVRNSFNKRMDDFDWDRLPNIETNTEIQGGGIKSTISTESGKGYETGSAFRKRHIKSHRGEILRQAENASNLMRENVEKEIKPGIAHKEQKEDEWISNRTSNALGRNIGYGKKWDRDRKIRNEGKYDNQNYDWKETKFRDNDELNKKLERLRKEKETEKEYAGLFDKITAKERLENIKNIRTKKNLKKAGLVGAGILGAGVAAYAGKKAYDRYKAKKQKEQEENKKERD